MSTSARTVADLGRRQLHAIADGLGLSSARRARMAQTFDALVAECGDQDLGAAPRWSGLADDCTPIEWSVAFHAGEPDVRVLMEAQSEPATLAGYAAAAAKLTRWTVTHLGADATLADRVADVFAPTHPEALAAAYHGVEFHGGGAVRTKLYLNPGAAGDRWTVTQRALDRLGLGACGAPLRAAAGPSDVPLVAVDLEPSAHARVKVYLRADTVEAYERVSRLASASSAEDLRPTLTTVLGSETLGRRPFLAVHLDESSARTLAPVRTVLSVPVVEGGVSSGAERVAALMRAHGLDARRFERVFAAVAAAAPSPPSDSPLGLLSWVSFQRGAGGAPRVTVYFRVLAFAPRWGFLSASDPPQVWPSPVPGA